MTSWTLAISKLYLNLPGISKNAVSLKSKKLQPIMYLLIQFRPPNAPPGAPPLIPTQLLNDQDGGFPFSDGKAYGPYQAIKLLQMNPVKARLNIENYVWYALVNIFRLCSNFRASQCLGIPNSLALPFGLRDSSTSQTVLILTLERRKRTGCMNVRTRPVNTAY